MTYGYIFMTRPTEQGVCVDAWLDVTEFIGVDKEEVVTVNQVRLRLDPDDEEAKASLHKAEMLSSSVKVMQMRARLNNLAGPCLVKAESELTVEQFESYLNHLTYERRQQFYKESRL